MSTEEDPRLIRIVEAIADGSPVDWSEAGDVVTPATDPLPELRAIAQLAAFHRQLIEDDSGQSLGDVLSVLPAASAQLDRSKGVPWGPLLVLDEIGGGSFGKVYRAWDPSLDHEVALKRLRLPADAPPSRAASIVREGQLLARVRHQNVITVHGACEINGEVGIWMDLVRGKTLEQIVRHDGPMSAQEASVVGESLCRALAAVHQAGLLHRDVKASNVMREAGGRIVVLDLGTSTETDIENPAALHRLVGTPLYMAPEILERAAASVRSDIYSLGVLLFYLTTGRYPVEGKSLVEIRAAHQAGRRRLLSDLRSDLPSYFVEAIERALSPVPEHRCQSAGEMLRSLSAGTSTGLLEPDKPRHPSAGGLGDVDLVASDFRGRLLLAKTPADLRRLKYELEGYLRTRPHDVDGRILSDEIERAIGLDVLTVAAQPKIGRHQETMSARSLRSHYRWAALATVVVAVLAGGLWLRRSELRYAGAAPTDSSPSAALTPPPSPASQDARAIDLKARANDSELKNQPLPPAPPTQSQQGLRPPLSRPSELPPSGSQPVLARKAAESLEEWRLRDLAIAVRYDRAKAEVESDAFQTAIRDLNALQRDEPNYLDVPTLLQRAQGRARAAAQGAIDQGASLEKQGQLPEALQQYRRALAADPSVPGAGESIQKVLARMKADGAEAYKSAMTYYTFAKYAQAIPLFEKAVKLLPDGDPDKKTAQDKLAEAKSRQ